MKRKLPPKAVPVLLGAGLMLIALIGWFAVVGPQRSHARTLQTQADAVQSQILVLNSTRNSPTGHQELVKVADLFRLSKAIPNSLRMPDILLELSDVAGKAGIDFDSITPGAPIATAGYEVVPINVVFQGNYYSLSEFLYRLRNLVEVHDGSLVSTGRLFDVDHLAFQAGKGGFPSLQASLTIDAFVYTGLPDPNAVPAGSTTSTDTTSTETTPTDGGTS